MTESREALIERLFAEYGSAIHAFFRRRIRDHAEAMDLTQEVFARMLRAPDLAALQTPVAYLFTVARNLLQEHSARARRWQNTVDVDDSAVQEQLAEQPTIGQEIDTEQRSRRLREVLKELPVKCQEVVRMRHWRGMSYQEIGDAMGFSTSMVKKYLSQALVHCHRRMGPPG